MPLPRRPMEKGLLERFEKNPDYWKAIELLGYEHPKSDLKFSSSQKKNDVFSIFDKIYCINLESATERKEHIIKEFDRMGITDYEFVKAVPKNSPEVIEAMKSDFVKKFPPCFRCRQVNCQCDNNVLIEPQIGNWFSFIKVWKDIVKNKYQFVLICEDDVKFTPYAGEVASFMLSEKTLERYNINLEKPVMLRLGWAKCSEHQYVGESSFKPIVRMANPCFAITYSMAEIFLKSLKQIYHTSDMYMHNDIASKYTHYSLFPPLCYELSCGEVPIFHSHIHPKQEYIDSLKSKLKKIEKDSAEYESLFKKIAFEEDKFRGHRMRENHNISISFPKRLNIGSGKTFKYNYLNLDISDYWKPDIIFNLNSPLLLDGKRKFQTARFGEITLQSGSFDRIVAHDVLEHIHNLTVCMESCLNLLKIGGIFEILVPYDLSHGAWQDPTHVRAFNEESWLYYTDWFWYLGWKNDRFEVNKLEYELSDLGKKLQKDGVIFEDILRTPRAIDYMLIFLKKVALNEKDRAMLNHYHPPPLKVIPETIWIVHRPNSPHFPFVEIAIALQSGFSELGYQVDIVNDIKKVRGKTLVLGCNRISLIGLTTLPKDLILFNLEQIQQGSPWLTEDYLILLKTYPVWDYSHVNIKALQKLGVKNITYCGIGYAPKLSRISPVKEDIDVLFYGALNPRRQKILDKLQVKGFNVVGLSQVYGNERDNYIARAKIVLNIHFYEAQIFEIIRVSYLLSNKKCVISEKGHDYELEKPFQDGVCFCDYEELVSKCTYYLKNNAARIQLAGKGFQCISMQSQAEFLRQASGRNIFK